MDDFGAGGYNDYHKGVSSVSIFESDWLDAHRVLYIWFIYGHEVKRKLPPLNSELWLVDTHDVPVATLFEWVSLSSRARADSRSAGQFGNFWILRCRAVRTTRLLSSSICMTGARQLDWQGKRRARCPRRSLRAWMPWKCWNLWTYVRWACPLGRGSCYSRQLPLLGRIKIEYLVEYAMIYVPEYLRRTKLGEQACMTTGIKRLMLGYWVASSSGMTIEDIRRQAAALGSAGKTFDELFSPPPHTAQVSHNPTPWWPQLLLPCRHSARHPSRSFLVSAIVTRGPYWPSNQVAKRWFTLRSFWLSLRRSACDPTGEGSSSEQGGECTDPHWGRTSLQRNFNQRVGSGEFASHGASVADGGLNQGSRWILPGIHHANLWVSGYIGLGGCVGLGFHVQGAPGHLRLHVGPHTPQHAHVPGQPTPPTLSALQTHVLEVGTPQIEQHGPPSRYQNNDGECRLFKAHNGDCPFGDQCKFTHTLAMGWNDAKNANQPGPQS